MDMQQPQQPQDDQGAQGYLALMKQAYDLLGQAIKAAGGEESSEEGGDMGQTRDDIARQVFGQ